MAKKSTKLFSNRHNFNAFMYLEMTVTRDFEHEVQIMIMLFLPTHKDKNGQNGCQCIPIISMFCFYKLGRSCVKQLCSKHQNKLNDADVIKLQISMYRTAVYTHVNGDMQ